MHMVHLWYWSIRRCQTFQFISHFKDEPQGQSNQHLLEDKLHLQMLKKTKDETYQRLICPL